MSVILAPPATKCPCAETPDNPDVVIVAGEAISAGRGVTIRDDVAWYFDATDPANYGTLAGVSANAASPGGDVRVVSVGTVELSGFAFVTDRQYFVSDNVGHITLNPITSSTHGLVAPIGYAVDSNTFFVSIETQLEV